MILLLARPTVPRLLLVAAVLLLLSFSTLQVSATASPPSLLPQPQSSNRKRMEQLQTLQRRLNDQSSSSWDGRYSLEFQQCLSWKQDEDGNGRTAQDVWKTLTYKNNDDYNSNNNQNDEDIDNGQDYGFDEFRTAWNKGWIVPLLTTATTTTSSYVVYRMCPTQQCQQQRRSWRRHGKDDQDEFFGMTTLEQYISRTRYQTINQRLDYCEGCQDGLAVYENDRAEFCQATSSTLQQLSSSSQADNNDDFFRHVVVINACDSSCPNQCSCYGYENGDDCYDELAQKESEVLNAMGSLLQTDGYNYNDDGGGGGDAATCIATGEKYHFDENGGDGGLPLYAKIMCNQEGTGWDVALFLDSDCTIYTSLSSFSDLIQEQLDDFYDDDYFAYNINNNNDDDNNENVDLGAVYSTLSTTVANEIVTAPFVRRINCANWEYVYSASDIDGSSGDDDNNNSYNDGDSSNTMNDYCQGVVQNSIFLSSCKAVDDADGRRLNDQYSYYNQQNNNDDRNQGYDGDSSTTLSTLQSMCEQIQHEYSAAGIGTLLRNHKNPYLAKGSGAMFDYGATTLRRRGESYPYYAMVELLIVVIVVAVVALAIRDMTYSSSPWSRFLWSKEEREQESQLKAQHKQELLATEKQPQRHDPERPMAVANPANSENGRSFYAPPPRLPQSPATQESELPAMEPSQMTSPPATSVSDLPQVSFSDPPQPASFSSLPSKRQEQYHHLPDDNTGNSSTSNLKVQDSEDGVMVIRGMISSFRSFGSSSSG